jgi:putative ABC transport system permease protein
MMIRTGMSTIAYGLVLGVILSFAMMRFMGGLLFAVRPSDPLTLSAAALVLMATAFLAILIPVRRATRVDPMVALRYE